MKKKCLIIYGFFLICIYCTGIEKFEIKFIKTIDTIEESFIPGSIALGPMFFGKNNVIYFKSSDTTRFYNIRKDRMINGEDIVEGGIKELFKIGTNKYIYNKNYEYIYQNDKFVKINWERYKIFNNYYYDYSKGIIKKNNSKFEIVIKENEDDEGISTFGTEPVFHNKNKNNFYFLKQVNDTDSSINLYNLMKYNVLKNKLEIIFKNVICFALIPHNPNYIIAYALGKHGYSDYHRGFVYIIDTNGKIVQDFSNFDNPDQYWLFSLDINIDNFIVSVGQYDEAIDDNKEITHSGILLFKLLIN